MLDTRTIQKHLGVTVDGIIGPQTIYAAQQLVLKIDKAAAQWNDKRILTAYSQFMLMEKGYPVGTIDGLKGSQTEYALELYQNDLRSVETSEDEIKHQPNIWPRQKDVKTFYGEVGQNQVMLQLPFKMKLAWDTNVEIHQFSIHKKVHDSAKRALENILKTYGEHMIDVLNINKFGGCLNVRKMRGGSDYSMHSWGIAIDFDPINNQLRWGRDKAALAGIDYLDFWKAWENEGWISLGKEKNYDWMHVQAARL